MITAFSGQASVMVLGRNSKCSPEVGDVPSLMGCYTSLKITEAFFCFLFCFPDTECKGCVIFKALKFIIVLQCKVYF